MSSIASTQISNIERDEKSGRIKANVSVGGFDAGAVRDAVAAGIEAKKIPTQERIEITEKRLEAQAEVQLVVGTILESLKGLQGTSIITSQSGVFGYTKAVLGTHKGEDTSNFFSVMVDSGTKPQNLEVSILKKAERDSIKATTAMPTETTEALNLTGDLTFANTSKDLSDGKTKVETAQTKLDNAVGAEDIATATAELATATTELDALNLKYPDIVFTLEATDTAANIKSKMNAQSDYTGVTAKLIPSGNSFKLSLDATDYSDPVTFTKDITGGDGSLIPDSSTKTKEDLQARLQVQGEESRHDTNIVNMLGMTFMLFKETQDDIMTPEIVSISIEYSPGDVAEKITELTETANKLKDVIEKYTAYDFKDLNLTQEEKDNFTPALLKSNTAIQDIERFMSTAMRQVIQANIGVSLSEGRYTTDAKVLNEAALNQMSDLEKVFVFSETSVNPKFSTTMHPSSIPTDLMNNEITVSLSKDGAGVVTATFDYPGSTGPSEAVNITEGSSFFMFGGNKESPYKDFSFFYSGTLNNGESATTTMSFTQGVADLGIGYLEDATNEDGIFHKQSTTYTTKIKSHEERLERIESTGSKKIERLEKKLAAAIQAIQSILSISNHVQSLERMAYAAAA